jgi:glutathione S-transferase
MHSLAGKPVATSDRRQATAPDGGLSSKDTPRRDARCLRIAIGTGTARPEGRAKKGGAFPPHGGVTAAARPACGTLLTRGCQQPVAMLSAPSIIGAVMSSSSLTLYATRAAFGLPDSSPFVIKTEVQLQMAGLACERVSAIPPQAPHGKLPFIDDHGQVVSDSTFIRAHVERKYAVDLDAGLDARQRAQAWAIERLLEDHLYFAMVWFRWIDPENFARGPAHFADDAPEADRAQLREGLQARKAAELHAQGLGRHAPAQIAALGKRSIDALAQLLGEQPYFMGLSPSGVDATAFGMLACVITPFFDTPLRRAAQAHPNLVAYVDRMMQRHYPQHAWG